MTNNYYQIFKERFPKEAGLKYQNLSKEKKEKGGKKSEKDIKIFLKNKSRSYLSI